ncbi:hypothetical protein [uncultured Methylobacterium sp.]|uniref:hypothetical protein n=1 Tax=uncultured Methylobacterium sp. TaxID=157278 RepID=UPI002611852D|nr:hypothetical protein [uncultured Methylobacterium sp.]
MIPADVVKRIGVANLERLRQGYTDGGLVGMSAPPFPRTDVSGTAGRGVITVAPQITVQASGSGTPEPNTDIAVQLGGQIEGAMRGVIRQELMVQMRNGGLLRQGP